jgi:VIT1/CCC1 family predicted Fe2+/Mn2+ transporter
MMAGAFLDVQTSRGIAKAELERERQEIQNNPEAEKQEVRERLSEQGFSAEDTNTIVAILERNAVGRRDRGGSGRAYWQIGQWLRVVKPDM